MKLYSVLVRETFKYLLSGDGCLGELEPRTDIRMSDAAREIVSRSRSESMRKHFMSAFGYIARSMEKVDAAR